MIANKSVGNTKTKMCKGNSATIAQYRSSGIYEFWYWLAGQFKEEEENKIDFYLWLFIYIIYNYSCLFAWVQSIPCGWLILNAVCAPIVLFFFFFLLLFWHRRWRRWWRFNECTHLITKPHLNKLKSSRWTEKANRKRNEL